MKKIIILIIILALFILSPTAFAKELDIEDIYNEQLESSNIDALNDALPDDIAEKLSEYNLFDYNKDFTENFSVKNIFSEIYSLFKSGFKKPFIAGAVIVAILLLGVVAGSLTERSNILDYAIVVGVTAAAIVPSALTLESSVEAIKSAGVFMLAFVPIFAGILTVRGKTFTAAGYSSVMLVAAEGISGVVSYFCTPLVSVQLSLGMCSSLIDEFNMSSILKAIKKISMWVLSLASTILLGILGIQTAITGPADNLGAKTAKFVIGTAVPVVGNTISEAFSTIKGCLKLISSSVAIYGVLAVLLIFLPIIVELVLWRLSLNVAAAVADMLGSEKPAALIRTVDSCYAFIIGVIILVAVVFLIAVAVVSLV